MLLFIAPPHIDLMKFSGDGLNCILREHASVPCPAAWLDIAGSDDVFDAVDWYDQPAGDFAYGRHCGGGR